MVVHAWIAGCFTILEGLTPALLAEVEAQEKNIQIKLNDVLLSARGYWLRQKGGVEIMFKI